MTRGLNLHPYRASNPSRIVGIAANHSGHDLKVHLAMRLRTAGTEVIDFDDRQLASMDDGHDFVVPLARAVAAGRVELGVAICCRGVEACVVANQVIGIRACLIHDSFSAHQGIEDHSLNLICIGILSADHAFAWELLCTFLSARYPNDARQRRRTGETEPLESHGKPEAIQSQSPTGGAVSGQTGTLKLHLIRHGETAWSVSGKHTGRTDISLTTRGEDEARALGVRLAGIAFSRVYTSPLQRARQTCALVALSPQVEIEPDLAEWDYGDYEGRLSAEIRLERPEWRIFDDGAPGGESTTQIATRADRLITRWKSLTGNVALFTHGHFGRVLAARWLGLSVEQSRPFMLSTASHSILGFEHDQPDEPAIELWNANASEPHLSIPGTGAKAAHAAQPAAGHQMETG